MIIDPKDLKVTVWPEREPGEAGGQTVGLTPTGVRVEHLPSGLVAIVQCERSQRRNREIALEMIMGGLTCPQYHI